VSGAALGIVTIRTRRLARLRKIDSQLAGISAAAKGEPGWPPLALFRGLLLATWHDLSDVRLA
jgi:hypothetical protein